MPAAPAETKTSNRIEARCADYGLRLTGQRLIIARVLADANDHPDVEELHRRAHALDPKIALSTAYRTTRLFAAKGTISHLYTSPSPRDSCASRIPSSA